MHVAVIGFGYWGPNLVRNLLENRKVTAVTICDSNPGQVERAAQRFPHVRAVDDADEVWKDTSIEAALIATPVSTHYALGAASLAAGKHTFIEKPLAASTAEAADLTRRAAESGLTLMVGHTFEYSPPVMKIREIIQSGSLGQIYYVSAVRVNLGIHQKDVSVVWDLAPHDLSMLFYWLGEMPTEVSMLGGAFVQPTVSDVAFINLQFASGIVGSIQVSWLSPSKLRQITIVGSKKMLVYDDTNAVERVKLYDRGVEFKEPTTFGEYTLTYRTGDIVAPHIPATEPLQTEIGHFLECALTGATPRTDGLSGLRVVQALEAIERSGQNGSRMERIRAPEPGEPVPVRAPHTNGR